VSVSSSEIDSWRTVAAGWERRQASFSRATSRLTERLIELADPGGDDVVLELAAGPGETGFAAAARLGSGGRLLSTDFAPEMVEVARRRGGELGLTNVEFRTMDAMAIDYTDSSVNVVLCRFGVMLTPEPSVTLGEIRRVLCEGGRAAIAVWAEAERNLWISAGGAAARDLELVPARDPDAPGPFRLADKARLRTLVEDAGLRVDVLEEVPVTCHAGSLDEWWEVAVDMSPGLSALAASSADALSRVRAAAEEQLAPYVADDGSVAPPGVAIAVLASR
jgi:SAM-dependent methyltransferase